MRLTEQVRRMAGRWTKALLGAALLAGPLPAFADTPATPPRVPSVTAAAAAGAPRPAIWLLEDEDTKIYLFGTNHIFAHGFRWRSERLDAVIREADELVMETADENEADDDALAADMFMDKAVPIVSRVSEPYRAPLRMMIEASGMPEEMWDQLHTWAAAFMVMGVQMMMALPEDQRGKENPMSGAEIELTAEFRRMGRPISAVETSAEQMGLFRTLSRRAQRAFLESMLVPGPDQPTQAEVAEALSGDPAWVNGDVEAIAAEMEQLPPELYEVLLTRRNRNWTEWLARRLERPGTVLFAVGVGHLAGRDSVQTMLAERGLRTRRID